MRRKSTTAPAYPQPVPDRPNFWDSVDLSDPEHCWAWQGRMVNNTPHLGNESARRIAWEACRGRLPARSILRHTCGEPACINPDHARLILAHPGFTAAKKPVKGRPNPRGRRFDQLSEVELRRFLIHPIEDLLP